MHKFQSFFFHSPKWFSTYLECCYYIVITLARNVRIANPPNGAIKHWVLHFAYDIVHIGGSYNVAKRVYVININVHVYETV